jgi:hypothetical protein
MNGRLYDPLLHRFLQPDNYVQDPTNTQNFNRYGYVLNNPLSNVDPSGEFIPLLAIGIGALIGAASGAAGYIGSAIRTGNWSWGQFGLSVLGGVIIGGISGGINPWSVVGQSFGGVVGTSFAAGLLPSINGQIGDFSFSISPAIAFGNSFGAGANLSASYKTGKFEISAGLGFMAYGNYQGFGKSGTEIRKSIMAEYNDGHTVLSIATNFWSGNGDMGEFKQHTGALGIRSGLFGFNYENDGLPFGFQNKFEMLADGNDSYRTAAASISIGNIKAGFNLFTGRRDDYSKDWLEMIFGRNSKGAYNETMNHGFVNEKGTPYILGAAYIQFGNIRAGIDSDRYIRHPIQNILAHHWIAKQPGFISYSNTIRPYFQYQTNNLFTSW